MPKKNLDQRMKDRWHRKMVKDRIKRETEIQEFLECDRHRKAILAIVMEEKP
jgi:hypothetical protein